MPSHHVKDVLMPIIAYIDPGTGSLLLQLLLGGLAGLWVMLKLYGRRIRSLLRKKDQNPANS